MTIKDIWYLSALSETEIEILEEYETVCEELHFNWRTQLSLDFQQGFSDFILDDDLDALQRVWCRIGPRMLKKRPLFQIGDGTHVLYKDGSKRPSTVVKVDSRNKVTVCFDTPRYRNGKTLFIPKSTGEGPTQVFSQRTDGTYRPLGHRHADTFLWLGRAFDLKRQGHATL